MARAFSLRRILVTFLLSGCSAWEKRALLEQIIATGSTITAGSDTPTAMLASGTVDLTMNYPAWTDEVLSRELPLLRDRGEGQHLEFMVSYPANGYDLSKEIAAFASSNPGTILIGVADDGSLAGLEDVETPEGRDRLCRRVEGVCSSNVRPAVTPEVQFAKEADAVVLAIKVPRGSQPIYYSRNTPMSGISLGHGPLSRMRLSSGLPSG
jgi:hypothetical protein